MCPTLSSPHKTRQFSALIPLMMLLMGFFSVPLAAENLPEGTVSVLPPDRIPSIDDPVIGALAEQRQFDRREPLLVVIIGDQARGYPLHLLMRHEIVNDTLAGTAIAATWCPLCDSSIVFAREIDGEKLVFGVSGRLRNSNLIMFDRQHGGFWQQANGMALTGPHRGQTLEAIPSRIMSGQDLLNEFPDASLGMHPQRGTGSGGNAYPQYDDPEGAPWREFITELPETPVPPMIRIIAIPDGDRWLALADDPQGGVRRISGETQDMIVAQRPGAPSAIDTQRIVRGRQLGDPVVFSDILHDKPLQLHAADAGPEGAVLVDQYGTSYDIHGRALAGPGQGQQLERIPFRRYLAFAWYAFYPDTIWLDD